MKLVYVLIQSVIGEIKQCCFEDWTEWQPNSLTCGRICNLRTRKIIDSNDDFWGAAGSWFGDTFGGTNSCNEIYSTCPTHESQSDSCVDKACREFRFKIILFQLNFVMFSNFLFASSSY